MSATLLTRESASALISEIFVYHMPFNRALGLELQRFEADYAELVFDSKEMLVGNAHQKILHGGVIASVLDVCAGLVCVGSALLRYDEITQEELLARLSKMGTIDMRVDYLRPGRGERFVASGSLQERVIKSRLRALNFITNQTYILLQPPPRIWSAR